MTQETAPQRRERSFWRTLGNVLKVLLQLILIVTFMGAVAVGLYFAIPWLYRETIVPVQNNTADIDDLDRRMDAVASQVDEQTTSLRSRNAELEGELTEVKETVAVQDRLLATAAAEIATLVPAADALTEASDTQASDLAALERTLSRAMRSLEDQAETLDVQAEEVTGLQEAVATQTMALTEQGDSISAQSNGLLSRMALLQAAQDLVRVQLLLLEDNAGAAQASLGYVLDHLVRAVALDAELSVDVADWANRVAGLETLIEDRSFRTTPELESLWADIADRALPELPEGVELLLIPSLTGTSAVTETLTDTAEITVTVTPTVTVLPTITPLPTPTPALTPTPTGTVSPTPTPKP